MMNHGGLSLRNLLTGHSLAVIVIVFGAMALLGLMHAGFKGSIVV